MDVLRALIVLGAESNHNRDKGNVDDSSRCSGVYELTDDMGILWV